MLPRLESRNLHLNFELDFELNLNSVVVTIRCVSVTPLKNAQLGLIVTQVSLFTG